MQQMGKYLPLFNVDVFSYQFHNLGDGSVSCFYWKYI